MKKRILTCVLIVFCCPVAWAEIVVVANINNTNNLLSIADVEDIFMGRKHSFPDGSLALPIDQVPLRPNFYQKLTSRPIEQINAYWARIIFSGEASPPMILPDDKAVIRAVMENKDTLGYIYKENLNEKLKVLLEIP